MPQKNKITISNNYDLEHSSTIKRVFSDGPLRGSGEAIPTATLTTKRQMSFLSISGFLAQNFRKLSISVSGYYRLNKEKRKHFSLCVFLMDHY